MAKLLIVESPTKAKTINKYLGKDYKVVSSFGHIRDLPKRKMGVDIKHGFEPTYEVPIDKKKKVQDLKTAAKTADEIYLATDEDREGEAIAWHIAEVLGLNEKTAKRITFHEITKSAIDNALTHARHIDMKLVDAQQTRRILDRLVGYELSPLLWRKVARGLSAGRVQSVAVKLVVERERERQAFKQDEFWTVEADFSKDKMLITSKLVAIGDKKLDKLDIKTEAEAKSIVDKVKDASFVVSNIETKDATRKPPTPLTTSTLQQEAYNKLGMSAKQTMTLAQRLYETGRITYMRTDSLNLAEQFLSAAQDYIKTAFGNEYAKGAVAYKTAKKGAQEAHEAIRPTNPADAPESLKGELEAGEWRLYDMIWRRTIASQMPGAKIRRTAVDLIGNNHTFRANGSTVVFPGFMKVWQSAEDKILPVLAAKDTLGTPEAVRHDQHFTEPPARYSDATLIKALEEHGIGRPSTYAPTLSTIIDRGYVVRDDNKKLAPSETAMIVTDLLSEHFPDIVNYEFTAQMEKKLDEIAEGTHNWQMVLSTFYGPFHDSVANKTTELSRADVMKQRVLGKDTKSGQEIIVRTGRFGPYVQVGEATDENPKPPRASLEKNQLIDTLTLEDALKLLAFPRQLGKLPNGEELEVHKGPYGPYLKAGKINVTLLPTTDPATVNFEEAKKLFAVGAEEKRKRLEPIAELGKHPETKLDLIVKSGRFGPYVTDGKINATIPKDQDPKTVTLEQAVELLAKKAARGNRRWPKKEKETA